MDLDEGFQLSPWRQAWLALVGHFEGDAQHDHVKDAAYAQ
jgi:hypothetical protein